MQINLSKKILIVLLLSVVVVSGIALYKTIYPPTIPETQSTDAITQNMIVQMEQYVQRMEAMKNSMEREVSKIHEAVKQEVSAMRPDDIATGLNDELSRFRELSIRSSGMDNPSPRILD